MDWNRTAKRKGNGKNTKEEKYENLPLSATVWILLLHKYSKKYTGFLNSHIYYLEGTS